MNHFLTDKRNRRWVLLLVAVVLFFVLLAWAAWLFFEWKLRGLK